MHLFMHAFSGRFSRASLEGISFNFFVCFILNVSLGSAPKRKNFDIQRNTRVASGGQFTLNYHTPSPILFATWKSFTFPDSESLNRCRRRKYLLTSSADRHSIYFVKVQRTLLLDLSGKCFAILWNLRWAGSKFKTKIYLNSRLLRPSTFQMSWKTKLCLLNILEEK